MLSRCVCNLQMDSELSSEFKSHSMSAIFLFFSDYFYISWGTVSIRFRTEIISVMWSSCHFVISLLHVWNQSLVTLSSRVGDLYKVKNSFTQTAFIIELYTRTDALFLSFPRVLLLYCSLLSSVAQDLFFTSSYFTLISHSLPFIVFSSM